MAEPILIAKNLVKTYTQSSGQFGFSKKQVKALDGVNLQLMPGQTLAIVGESGSGKSTLARCLLQLQSVDDGAVLFAPNNDGILTDLSVLNATELRKMRRHMQMVFQDPFASLNPRMRIGEIVGEGLKIHSIGSLAEQQQSVLTMLKRVGLDSADMQKYPHEFSGGQRQRIGIARALVLKPKVVICDEPVSALDVSIQAQILLLLKSLQAEMDLSYLFITHDLRVVRHIANDVLVMHQGRVVEEGAVADIFAQPKQGYTQQLLASIPGKQMTNC